MRATIRIGSAGAVIGLSLIAAACDWAQPGGAAADKRASASQQAMARKLQAACSSPTTYDRLKIAAFDEAVRIRNADPVNLDKLAAHAFVRVEQPRVVSHDNTLDVTVCKGRFILQLPPGAERAFAGERQLVANIEYAAQAAADGSGLVYQIEGAEPIIYKLAAFDLKSQGASVAVAPSPIPAPPTERVSVREPDPRIASAAPEKAQRNTSTPMHRSSPAQPQQNRAPEQATRQPAQPSFNCRKAHTRSEKMVCESTNLARLDRAMSSRYYSALSAADEGGRAALRRTRDRFLAYRERCGTEGCVAQAYRDRMDEIEDMVGRP